MKDENGVAVIAGLFDASKRAMDSSISLGTNRRLMLKRRN